MQQHRGRVYSLTVARFPKLAESQHPFIVSGMPWVNLDKEIGRPMNDASTYIRKIEEGRKQLLRAELGIYRQL